MKIVSLSSRLRENPRRKFLSTAFSCAQSRKWFIKFSFSERVQLENLFDVGQGKTQRVNELTGIFLFFFLRLINVLRFFFLPHGFLVFSHMQFFSGFIMDLKWHWMVSGFDFSWRGCEANSHRLWKNKIVIDSRIFQSKLVATSNMNYQLVEFQLCTYW
jgi:hypothetical protein